MFKNEGNIQMSSKRYEESDYGVGLDLLTFSSQSTHMGGNLHERQ